MPFDQIHFGAGRRGVGAILPLSIDAGARVHVVVHTASELTRDSELVCTVCGPNGQRRDRPLEIASLSIANTIEQLDDRARAAIDAAPCLLLTTAITPDGIVDQSRFLLAIARERAGKQTIFIPCEEEVGEEQAELFEQLRELGVDVRRSVVNRLCSREMVATGRDRRAVRADQHVEWFIEGQPTGPLLESLEQVPGVAFTEHIEEHALRTRWLVRGIRLALALLAAEAKQPQLRTQAAESARDGWLERVYAAFVPLVEGRCEEFVDTAGYAREQVEALLRHYDDGESALRKLRRDRLLPFLRELQSTIGEPCREVVWSTGELPSELQRVFLAIEVVLRAIERYSDYDRYCSRDMVLSADADAKVVGAYRELLTGVLPPEKVEARVFSLGYQLEQHRNEL